MSFIAHKKLGIGNMYGNLFFKNEKLVIKQMNKILIQI